MKRFIMLLWVMLPALPNRIMAEPEQLPYPLGCFDFDFKRLAAAEGEQIRLLRGMGYNGMTMPLGNSTQLALFDKYAAVLQPNDFRFYAGYVGPTFTADNTALHAHLAQVLSRLKTVDGKLWLIVQNTALARSGVVAAIRAIADQSKAAGVELVLYPHDNTYIESAEEALVFIEELNHDNIFVSLHLCHEIRAGNGGRLDAVAMAIQPYLRLPSISGANIAYNDNSANWSDSIQPLGQGDYDASKLVRALEGVGYDGPVILHTFGAQIPSQSWNWPADHHQRSSYVYQRMFGPLQGHFAFLFNQNGNFEGWAGNARVSNATVVGGALTATLTGVDPQFVRSTALNIQGSNVPIVLVRMMSSAGGVAVIFFGNELGGIVAANSVTFSVPAGGVYQWYAVNVGANANWSGHTIKALRLDPPASSGTTSIDAIIGSNGDFNQNGLSDLWEAANNLDPTAPADPLKDSDNDGLTDAAEFTFGTNPTASNSAPLLTATSSGGTFTLTFIATQASGIGYDGLTRIYDVEMTSNLANPASWTGVAGYTNIIGSNQTVTVPQPVSTVPHFYRLKVRVE